MQSRDVKSRLVVLDDEPGLCAFVAEVAEQQGFEASGFTEAVDLGPVLRLAPDVIVLDLILPGIDGIETLRNLAEAGCSARLILVSGFDRKVLEAAGRLATTLGLAVVGILSKPFGAAALRTMLKAQTQAVERFKNSRVEGITVAGLRRAIDQDELVLYYQPQVSLEDGAWVGTEVLVRWQHPDLGLIYPDAFIPIVENNGLALDMTRLITQKGIGEFVPIAERCDYRGSLSINFPPVALTDRTFPQRVSEMVSRAGNGKARIVFEVTETSVVVDPAAALEILTRFRIKGFGVAIDDYGTGQSSLENLSRLPISELKIDKTFLQRLDTEPTAAAIVENSIQLGLSLGLGVVAEGVESPSHWRWLKAHGCHTAQGYFVARPMRAERLPVWSKEWEAPR